MAQQRLDGLQRAEHEFGPLLSPITASSGKWNDYVAHRTSTAKSEEYEALNPEGDGDDEDDYDDDIYSTFGGTNPRILHRAIHDRVGELEGEIGVPRGTFQKGIFLLDSTIKIDDGSLTRPENGTVRTRIYSPGTPSYIDVDLRYNSFSRSYKHEWWYSLGFHVVNDPKPPRPGREQADDNFGFGDDDFDPSVGMVFQPGFSRDHTSNDWFPFSWGEYDGFGINGLDGPRWKKIDVAFRRMLVLTTSLILACVGIGYQIACADSERDFAPHESGRWKLQWMLEGLAGNWVARGIRGACGFQLSRDSEDADKLKRVRKEEASVANGGDDDPNMPDEVYMRAYARRW
ncbi:hypothetical protein CONPUDRAFT_168437 [Coniophora puteana RWD-64-598 SS2]|uniref:Uncharacterized protein n=1 Tax=Coniophora puteana (strain RWD-64-598) TaxID=741705 RepID=A0A5M3MC31_CONPW|nr:uncharacterized protein CONPUDRAFT_168437 [Coniophora puteana RWD-64-598 SS2]EIW76607.1 hypothetical protein CONPUDRAFT_168437 [Coniophora puteana RWD-64-598 SS2]